MCGLKWQASSDRPYRLGDVVVHASRQAHLAVAFHQSLADCTRHIIEVIPNGRFLIDMAHYDMASKRNELAASLLHILSLPVVMCHHTTL